AYINKTLDDLMQRAKAKVKAEKARAQQRKQADYKPVGLIWYDFTADTSASQPTSQRKPAIDTDDMFAPLLQAVARIKGVEV
ncbi:hypothetical protein, partial [Edwardsiella tarda]|uniref:hypothetical protein n=1 Tax=Edwardsiella tarda TaxID=636 RepID=UPI001C378F42